MQFAADADPAHHEEVRDGVAGMLDRLAAGGIYHAALEKLRAAHARAEPDATLAGYLDAQARNFVLGGPRRSFEEWDAFDVTMPDVSAALREIASSAIYLMPQGISMSYPPVTVEWSRETVDGRSFRSVDRRAALVVGHQGVTVIQDDKPLTVHWSDASLALWWNDGARVLVNRNGDSLNIVPDDWRSGRDAVALFDQYAPRQMFVPSGDNGPRPVYAPAKPARWSLFRRRAKRPSFVRRRPRLLRRWCIVMFWLGVPLLIVGIRNEPPRPRDDGTKELGPWGSLRIGLVLTALALAIAGALLVDRWRERREHR